jgi:basic membrane protein A
MSWAVLTAALVLAGCGGDQTSTSGQVGMQSGTNGSGGNPSIKPLVVGIVFDKGGRGDKSFNDSAYAGVQKAQRELGVKIQPLDSKTEKDYETNLSTMAEQSGCDIVFAIGAAMKPALEKVAGENPNVKFAIVDASVKKDNVRSLLFKSEQGSFLAGYLAGLMTKTNKIGFVGGQEIDLIKNFLSGYQAGAKAANPKVQVLPAKYTGDWDNIDIAKAAANTLYADGADIVYHAAGRAGLGVIKAAQEHKLYAIGVDSDQDALAPGYVLTSMVKHVDLAVYNAIKDLRDNKFTAGDKVYDLSSGLVGLSAMKFTEKTIGKAILAKVAAEKAKIIAGKVTVPSTDAQYAQSAPTK